MLTLAIKNSDNVGEIHKNSHLAKGHQPNSQWNQPNRI